MIVITNEGTIRDFIIAIEIDDSSIKTLEYDTLKSKDIIFMASLANNKGNNLHIISLNLDGKAKQFIKLIRDLKGYKSISWVHKDKFYIRRTNDSRTNN